MAKRRTTFRQSDVKRAVAGIKAAGLEVARVEVSADGVITITTQPEQGSAPAPSPLDAWLATQNR